MKPADLNTLPASIKPELEEAYIANVAHLTGKLLPVIIDTAPAEYLTRNGQLVVIHAIETSDMTTFNCKGTLFFPPKKPGGRVKSDYNIWKPNGRFRALGESIFDIVRKA